MKHAIEPAAIFGTGRPAVGRRLATTTPGPGKVLATRTCWSVWHDLFKRLLGLIPLAFLASAFWPSSSWARCPSVPLASCQATAPEGALLHNPNSNGRLVWTTACGPNTLQQHPDRICDEVASCPGSGGFGKFLRAVTFDCKGKHFDGYFGLDGMTFGILDWTANNLPDVLHVFLEHDPEDFNKTLRTLDLPMRNGCLDSRWTCESNKQARLMCDSKFHGAFEDSLKTPGLQKAQARFALQLYEERLSRFASLELQTEYGNTAMAVVANNLKRGSQCLPKTWKALCSAHRDEIQMVDCMLEQYVQNSCRGSSDGSRDRRDAIQRVFRDQPPSQNIHPSVESVIACSNNWGGK